MLTKMGISRRHLNGEILDADHVATQKNFIQLFGTVISGYDPDLVFNFDETALYMGDVHQFQLLCEYHSSKKGRTSCCPLNQDSSFLLVHLTAVFFGSHQFDEFFFFF